MIETIKPMEIEKRSFAIITSFGRPSLFAGAGTDHNGSSTRLRILTMPISWPFLQMQCSPGWKHCVGAVISSPIPRWRKRGSTKPS